MAHHFSFSFRANQQSQDIARASPSDARQETTHFLTLFPI
jgi:hypothetical protein